VPIVENWQVQGHSDPNRELLDAAALCRQLVPAGSVEAFLADHRHDLFPDEMFEDLFPSGRGRPSIPADVVASVMVLQSLEGLSDRDAARALRDRISWKVACGLALDDQGFDFSVLTYWRTRLRKSECPERIFDAVRSVIDATGVLKGKTRRALDSTLLDDAVATQDTVTQLVAAIRRVRRVVPGALGVVLSAHDYDSAGKPLIAWDDPVAKAQLIDGLVRDALTLLEAFDPVPDDADVASALGLLALVAGQDVEQDEDGTWKIAQRVAKDRIISVVDPEARHMHKSRSEYCDGYKAHIAIEPETGLVTAAALTPANTPDGSTGVELLAGEEPGLQVLGDGAYGTGDTLAALGEAKHQVAIKPFPVSNVIPGGFTREDFAVDEAAGTATCPAGHTVTITPRRAAVFGIRCRDCPLRERCTRSKDGRTLHLHPHDAELVESRRASREGDFKEDYRR
jgi:IS5 family transposase